MPVSSILGYMAAGMTHEEILADFPGLSAERPARSARIRRGSREREGVALPRDGVRFLVDENLPRRFAELLRAAGHEASHVAERNLAGATDETLWRSH